MMEVVFNTFIQKT